MSHFLKGITRPGNAEVSNPRHSGLSIYSRAKLQLVGPDGEIKHDGGWAHNVMNTYGLSRLVSFLAAGTAETASWIAAMRIGTDNTVAASNDASLNATVGSTAVTDPGSVIEAGARTLRCVATFASNNPAGAAQIREIGLYASTNATTGLVNRIDLTGANSVNKGASDSINVSIDVVFTTA